MISIASMTIMLAILFSAKATAGPLSDRFYSIPLKEQTELLRDAPNHSVFDIDEQVELLRDRLSYPSTPIVSVTFEVQPGCGSDTVCPGYFLTIVGDRTIIFVGNPKDARIIQFADFWTRYKSGVYLGVADWKPLNMLFHYIEKSGFFDVSAIYDSGFSHPDSYYLSVRRNGKDSLVRGLGTSDPLEFQVIKYLIHEIVRNAKYELSETD